MFPCNNRHIVQTQSIMIIKWITAGISTRCSDTKRNTNRTKKQCKLYYNHGQLHYQVDPECDPVWSPSGVLFITLYSSMESLSESLAPLRPMRWRTLRRGSPTLNRTLRPSGRTNFPRRKTYSDDAGRAWNEKCDAKIWICMLLFAILELGAFLQVKNLENSMPWICPNPISQTFRTAGYLFIGWKSSLSRAIVFILQKKISIWIWNELWRNLRSFFLFFSLMQEPSRSLVIRSRLYNSLTHLSFSSPVIHFLLFGQCT